MGPPPAPGGALTLRHAPPVAGGVSYWKPSLRVSACPLLMSMIKMSTWPGPCAGVTTSIVVSFAMFSTKLCYLCANLVTCTRYLVLGTWYLVLNTWYLVPGTWYK
mgnify:CR=1 FL=1